MSNKELYANSLKLRKRQRANEIEGLKRPYLRLAGDAGSSVEQASTTPVDKNTSPYDLADLPMSQKQFGRTKHDRYDIG
ncbi:MAG: hypothetical protein AAFR75_03220 [Pseudomonadota bacterium]